MPPVLVLLSTLIGSIFPCLEQIIMVPKVFETLRFDCRNKSGPRGLIVYKAKREDSDERSKLAVSCFHVQNLRLLL